MPELNKILTLALGAAVLFILMNTVIVPNWNTASGSNVSSTGLSAAGFQGLMLVIFIAIIGAAIYTVYKGK